MTQLVEDELEPDLGRLVLDDEQDLVVGVGARVLGAQDGIEMQVLAVAELALHLQVGAFEIGSAGHRSSFRMRRMTAVVTGGSGRADGAGRLARVGGPATGLGVRHGRERDEFVERHEVLGQGPLERVFGTLLRAEDRRRDAVAHLDEVVEGQFGDRVRVRASALGVARQRDGPVVVGLGEASVQLHDVLEAAVHALTVERHDRVGGVADERDPAADPRPAVDRDEGADADGRGTGPAGPA